ncbi:MAG TPA: FAD-dependent oxidoreductase [Thermoanaerobaculia bacterium]
MSAVAPAVSRPFILAVDDDPDVLRSIERDLRSHYAEKWRIVSVASGEAGLDLLRRIKQRGDAVALLVADQRMPRMTGVTFLREAQAIFPEARRVLLTAYADTDAAIRAINDAKIQHYLLKPWEPPERELFPVLDDLLSDWTAGYRPRFNGLRLIGGRWNAQSYALKDFLARSQVPYAWIDVEAASLSSEQQTLVDTLDTSKLPLLLFPDGSQLVQPTASDVAEKIGLRRHANANFYDVVIIGGGPAGLAASVYAASEGLKTLMVEREAPGGQAGLSARIENYLGFPAGISGSDLARRAVTQAKRFGVEILAPQEARSLRVTNPYRVVTLGDGTEISSHAMLIATGVQWRALEVDGIERFHGAGVYYGGTMTEALSCEGEDIYIVGGANSAGQAAMNFARYARTVTMLVRGPSLSATMSQYLIDDIKRTANIRVEVNTSIVGCDGGDRLESLTLRCSTAGEISTVPASSVYIFIGASPGTDWLNGVVERDERGFIVTGPDLMHGGKRPKGWMLDRDPMLLETSVPGVFAAGDVRGRSIKRVASGVGEGSVAVQFIHEYLASV